MGGRLIDADLMREKAYQMNFDRRINERELFLFNRALSEMPTVDAVPVVFINDPFHVVYQAFKKLYPDKECEIMFDYNVETTDTHERVKGVTIFPDDGSIPQIRIDCEQTIDQISGILAHELAHVALGKPEWDDRELDHGDDFERTLDAIFDRFNELQGFCADGKRRTDE